MCGIFYPTTNNNNNTIIKKYPINLAESIIYMHLLREDHSSSQNDVARESLSSMFFGCCCDIQWNA